MNEKTFTWMLHTTRIWRSVRNEDGSFDPDKVRAGLEKWFHELHFVDPWVAAEGYGGHYHYKSFHMVADTAAEALISSLQTQEEIIAFFKETVRRSCAGAGGVPMSDWPLRFDFWAERLAGYVDDKEFLRALQDIRQIICDARGEGALVVVDRFLSRHASYLE